MIPWIIISVVLFVAGLFDIKYKEVPDLLSYIFIISGIGYAAINSVIDWSWSALLFSALGFFAMFALSLLLYYTGQWGGGDAKLLMGVGAWLGLQTPELLVFLGNLILVGGVYGLGWSFYLMIKHFKKFRKEYEKLLSMNRIWRVAGALTALAIALAAYLFITNLLFKITFVLVPLFLFLFTYVWLVTKAVEKACFYKWTKPDKLVEGDWVVKPVVLDGKTILKPAEFGITKKQIGFLLRHNKQIRVLIKEGIPFVPSFFLAALITLIFDNWYMTLF